MPTAPASRAALRQSRRFLFRRTDFRTASTTAETASKAKDAASDVASKAKDSTSNVVSKASEGLSRVQSSAGSIVTGAASSARNVLGRVGGRTGRAIQFVESLIPPTIYYTRVGLELSKLVFQGQKMAPPSISQFQTYFQPITNAVRNPRTFMSSLSAMAGGATPESILSSVRNINRQQVATIGVVGAEVLGFFTVGTMIGRMKIVGYRGGEAHGH